MIVEGFLSRSPEGRTRVFIKDEPERAFVDVDQAHVRDVQLVEKHDSPLAVWTVRVDDDAEVTEGRLDPAEFDELFAWAGDAPEREAANFPSRPGTTCGAHDSSTRMGVCVPC